MKGPECQDCQQNRCIRFCGLLPLSKFNKTNRIQMRHQNRTSEGPVGASFFGGVSFPQLLRSFLLSLLPPTVSPSSFSHLSLQSPPPICLFCSSPQQLLSPHSLTTLSPAQFTSYPQLSLSHFSFSSFIFASSYLVPF